MNSSASSSSLTSSSSAASSGVLGDREVKKIEKIMARAAAADEKQLDAALGDVKKAEKALTKSSKVSAFPYWMLYMFFSVRGSSWTHC